MDRHRTRFVIYWSRIIGMILLGVLLFAFVYGMLMFYVPSDTIVLTPCVTEDQSTDCYWDASTRGNGDGVDFIVHDGFIYTPIKRIAR